MYNKTILDRFQNLEYAGGLRGANGTGKAGDSECGDLIKIYILVDDNEKIQTAKFKTYGKVCTIVASDIACQLIERKDLQHALSVSAMDILDEMGEVPTEKQYCASMAEEAVKNAVEDYYKKKEKEEKNQK